MNLLFDEVSNYGEAVVTYKDERGYPFSFQTTFSLDKASSLILLKKPSYIETYFDGKIKVSILFNHIKPLPSGGYTERRYITVWAKPITKNEILEARPLKYYSWDESKIPFPQYCERGIKRAHRYISFIREKYSKNIKPKLPLSSLILRTTRLPFLVATWIPVLLGILTALRQGLFDPFLALLTFIGASFIHIGLNVLNDYFDHKLNADWVNDKPTPFSGGSRAIQYGLFSPNEVLLISTFSYILGAVIGLYLALTKGFFLLVIAGLGLFLSIAYSAPPLKLSYRGFGEMAVGIGFGPIVVLGSYYVQTQQFDLEPLIASIPIGILIALILYVNEIPDKPYDEKAEKRTLVVRLKDEDVKRVYALLLISVYTILALAVFLKLQPITTLLALSSIPLALKVNRMLKITYGDPYRMIPVMASNIKLYLLIGILILSGYLLNLIIPI
ncbi:MAG: 1,4-dihydroxy-2-naphthoate octaprenyltransferase [Nitrososphaerales archaeon]